MYSQMLDAGQIRQKVSVQGVVFQTCVTAGRRVKKSGPSTSAQSKVTDLTIPHGLLGVYCPIQICNII